MKFKTYYKKSLIHRECDQEGQSIEEQIRQATANNQPIEASAPMIYTEDAKGIEPQYDPRTDKYEIALDAIDKYHKSQIARAAENAPTEPAEQKSE